MKSLRQFWIKISEPWLKACLITLLILMLSWSLSLPVWAVEKRDSIMPQGNAITDGQALLRYALPIENSTIRQIQSSLEDIDNHIRSKRWAPITSDVSKASRLLSSNQEQILQSISSERQSQGESLLGEVTESLNQLRVAVEGKNREEVIPTQKTVLKQIGEIEQLMVQKYPFEVPEKYSNLPQLKGRATIEMETNKGQVTLIVDGYSAPLTSGNFVDLVQRGFYNGLPFIRSEESYFLQAGDPPGSDIGFVDPKTQKLRTIPLEVLVQGDPVPTYEMTLEEMGRYRAQPVLPFSAYGALAMARSEEDPNSASSQFFFFLFEPELTPAGLNLLDGRYAVFGYVVEGKEVLEELKQGDKIVSAKVVQGAENLVNP